MSAQSKPISVTQQRPPLAIAEDDVIADQQDERPFLSGFIWFRAIPSYLASFLLNVSLILLLALFAIPIEQKSTISMEAGEIDSASIDDAHFSLDDLKLDDADPLQAELSEPPPQNFASELEPLTIDTPLTSEAATLMASDTTSFEGEVFDQLSQSETTSEVSGRSANTRNRLLSRFGGNAASENAVELALQWIADHQLPDGGWNLDHTIGPKVNDRPRTSPNPGEMTNARMGATALALLPFLGNGQTHQNGKHKQVVFDGLKFLMERPVQRGKGLGYWDEDGEMYSHGMVAIVFNECYAMTGDEILRDFAQGTIHFIEDFQDPVGGGWRYIHQERGDTSVVGWQIMALKSGKLTGLDVNKRALKLAKKFLDDVSIDYGAFYGYLSKPPKTASDKVARSYRALTAIGLLCRMYMGWDQDERGLVEGVAWLADQGPDVDADEVVNMYYNYYATQVMKHYGGEEWRRWNETMRDFLVASQESTGPAKGSWLFNPDGEYTAPGGRLYVTSMACMTLEVYYRFLPLYDDNAIDDEFPLD